MTNPYAISDIQPIDTAAGGVANLLDLGLESPSPVKSYATNGPMGAIDILDPLSQSASAPKQPPAASNPFAGMSVTAPTNPTPAPMLGGALNLSGIF